jgi:hypothetical protein
MLRVAAVYTPRLILVLSELGHSRREMERKSAIPTASEQKPE